MGTSSVGRIDGQRRHWIGNASSRRCSSAVRRVAAYIEADDRLTSSAQRFVDFSNTAASQQRASS